MRNLAYYTGLLTSQYRQSTNMLAWLGANIQFYQDGIDCLNAFGAAFDIDTTTGLMLDFLGASIGVSRTTPFQPSGGVSPTLTDDVYRFLLRATILRNHWDGRLTTILKNWQALFPGTLLIMSDQQNMSVEVIIAVSAGTIVSIIEDLITHDMILPRPQGVRYTYTFPTMPMLGFDRDDSMIAGYGVGHFV